MIETPRVFCTYSPEGQLVEKVPRQDQQTIDFAVQHLTQMLQSARSDKKASGPSGLWGFVV